MILPNWRYAATAGLAALAIGAALLPRHYRSEADLLLAPKPGVDAEAVNRQFKALKGELLSEASLTELARFLRRTVPEIRDRDIRITRLPSPESQSILFSVSCEGKDPAKSAKAVEWLVNILKTGDHRFGSEAVLEVVKVPAHA